MRIDENSRHPFFNQGKTILKENLRQTWLMIGVRQLETPEFLLDFKDIQLQLAGHCSLTCIIPKQRTIKKPQLNHISST